MHYTLCKSRRKRREIFCVSTSDTPLLKACLVKSCFAAIVDMWLVQVHYEGLVSDMMLALRVEK